MKKIVILGGGFGGVEFYRTLHKKLHGAPTVTFHMISRWNYFLFYPMLHEVATGSVERGHITQPLREIVDCCTEAFTQAEIKKIDFHARTVHTDAGPVGYDYLIVSLGTRPHYFGTPGAAEHCLTFKSIQDAVAVRNSVIHNFELAAKEKDAARRKHLLSFVIVGGGAVGVELAGQIADLVFNEMRDLYREVDHTEISITLVESNERLLKQMHPKLSDAAQRRLHEMGVRVRLNTMVSSCESDCVMLKSGERIEGSLRIWAAGITSVLDGVVDPEFLTARKLLKTEATLQLVGHPEVFVIGDNMEIVSPEPRMVPQTAQAAGASARVAARNMLRLLQNKQLQPFTYSSVGDIVPIGDWFAVAQFGGIHFFGALAWVMRRAVFLKRIWSLMNRVKIFLDWVLHGLMPRDTSEL